MTVKIEMEMPKSCRECKFYEFISGDYTKVFCTVLDNWIKGKRWGRSPDCPLQEVKEN